MRICFAIYKRSGGGAERAVSELASVLAGRGHDITIIQKVRQDPEYPCDPRVRTFVLDEPKSRILGMLRLGELERFKIFHELVQKIDPDVLVSFLTWADAFCFLSAKLSGRKVINAIRCNPAVYPEEPLGRLLRNLRCFGSDGIYVQNQAQGRYFPEFMQKRIFALPNITRREFFAIEAKPTGSITNFVSAGRLTAQKNQEMLVRAFSDVVRRHPDEPLTLSIYGEGELEESLSALISEEGMRDRIFLKGYALDLASIYREADAFILTSDYEGQPNALMEAMASGLPCISTDCPTGPGELIETGYTGILVPVKDQNSLAGAIEWLISHPDEARMKGRNGKAHIQELTDPQRVGSAFVDKCLEITSRG